MKKLKLKCVAELTGLVYTYRRVFPDVDFYTGDYNAVLVSKDAADLIIREHTAFDEAQGDVHLYWCEEV